MTTAPRAVPPTVVLFDIDGTLVTCGGAGRIAMERAFADQLGTRTVADFGFGGMTDRAIAREGLLRGGLAPEEDELDAFLERYLAYLAEELPRSAGYRVLAGVTQALDTLEALRNEGHPIGIGLGTGNLERGARLKLEPGSLWHRFAFGGYGSDHEDRSLLLERGAARGAEALRVPRESARVVVIGDTPRDVAAAHAIGAHCIAVASGPFDAAALAAHQPRKVHTTLESLALDDLFD